MRAFERSTTMAATALIGIYGNPTKATQRGLVHSNLQLLNIDRFKFTLRNRNVKPKCTRKQKKTKPRSYIHTHTDRHV